MIRGVGLGSAGILACRIADILVGRFNNASAPQVKNLRYGRLESLRYDRGAATKHLVPPD